MSMTELSAPLDPLSEDDFNALEKTLENSLREIESLQSTTDFLPRLQSYQEIRRQRARKRPKADKKPENAYHHGNLRQSFITITMEQAEIHGISEISLRNIAKQAGVSAPALYRHFKDKEALLAAVAEQGFLELYEWLTIAAPEIIPPEQALPRFFSAYIEFMSTYPVYFHLMFGPELQNRQSYPDLLTAHEKLLSLLIALILRGRQAQIFSQSISVEAQALSCWSALHGFAGLSIMGLIDNNKDSLSQLINGLSHGLQLE